MQKDQFYNRSLRYIIEKRETASGLKFMLQDYFKTAFFGLITSFVLALLISTVFRVWSRPDFNMNKKRAAHALPTSRFGGLGVGISIILVVLLNDNAWHIEIVLAAFPIFLVGLIEDLGKPIKPGLRLAVGALSAAIFIFFEEHVITNIGIIGVDAILAYRSISVVFTIFCIVALINALNFIDGINGLASGKTMIAAFALFWLANMYYEPYLKLLGIAIFSATLGLFMLNFPQGRIFLGDAGAYTLGFLLAVSFITLHSKNPEISAWAIMLIIFWPIVDMAHAILRRRLKHSRADRPDFLHFHHIVMRSLIIYSGGRLTKSVANPLATAIILPLATIPVVLGVIYHEHDIICFTLFCVFAILLGLLHRILVRLATLRKLRF